MNNTNIPPTKIKNKIYENQNLLVINPVIQQIVTVWINNIIPILNGWLICIKINLNNKVNVYNISCIISRNSLLKILILEIKDKELFFFLEV